MSSENLLKTIDNNMGDSLLNDSGYLQSDATAKRVDQKRLETFSIPHKDLTTTMRKFRIP